MDKLTTDEYNSYIKLKKKIKTKTRGTQTDVPLPNITLLLPKTYTGYEEYEEDSYDNDPDYVPEKKHNKLKRHYNNEDTSYYEELNKNRKKKIDKIEKQIFDINHVKTPLRFKILESEMDIKLKSIAMTKVDQLSQMRTSDNEYFKLRTWIENLSKIPVGKYKPLPITSNNSVDEIKNFLDKTKKDLNNTVYGHEDAKDQLIRLLCKWISNPNAGGLVIGMQGAPGTGKTELSSNIAKILGLPMAFISMGTCSCSTDLVGSSYVYEGSRWGRLTAELIKSEHMNPLFYFDELDKISPTKYGEEIVSTLIHMTDSTQNMRFHDRYFSDVDLDFSKCVIIFSYNDEEKINPILKDRMVTIRVNGYNSKEKTKIAKEYLLPKIFKEYAFKPGEIVFHDDVVKHVVSIVDEEQGVRNLKRGLEDIVSQINLHRLLKKELCNKKIEFPLDVQKDLVDSFVKKKETKLRVPTMYT